MEVPNWFAGSVTVSRCLYQGHSIIERVSCTPSHSGKPHDGPSLI